MEAAFKKRPSPDSSQESGKDEKQEHSTGKETGKDKVWWEQFVGAIPDDKEEQKKWYKLLTHPLAVIAGLIVLAYWWFNQKQKHYIRIERKNAELKTKINRLKKKMQKTQKENACQCKREIQSFRSIGLTLNDTTVKR